MSGSWTWIVVTGIFAYIMAKLQNNRHEKFAKLMALHSNASRAARGAGYSERSCGSEGYRLLKDPVIMARILQLQAGDAKKLAMTKEEALEELDALASFNPSDLYDDDGELIPIQHLPRHVAASIREIKSKSRVTVNADGSESVVVSPELIKAGNDKRAAIDMVLRIHNAYEDHEGAGKGEIHIHLDELDLQA